MADATTGAAIRESTNGADGQKMLPFRMNSDSPVASAELIEHACKMAKELLDLCDAGGLTLAAARFSSGLDALEDAAHELESKRR